MNAYTLILGTIFSFITSASCLSAEPQATQTLKTSYQTQAQNVAAANRWRDGPASAALQQSLDQLKNVAIDLMKQPDYAPAMLDLLNSYRDQDGYPRQQLFEAICYGHKYQSGELPFLKDVLLASLSYKYEDYPERAYQIWYTPRRIRYQLPMLILPLSSKSHSVDEQDWALLDSNPAAWIEKYAH